MAAAVEQSALQILLAETETPDAVQWVYLVTLSRVTEAALPDGRPYQDLNAVSREQVAAAVADSFNDPLRPVAGGRPRADGPRPPIVSMLIAFQEKHQDGDAHFHVVVKLARSYRFMAAKRTLRERHRLPSHFSCTHKLMWSAVRYGVFPTPLKPDVDAEPWVWTPTRQAFAKDCPDVDLFQLAQEPFQADSWRKRREKQDMDASLKRTSATFGKLDLTALVVSKHLWTKDSLLAYIQDHGTSAMQVFVHGRQKKLLADLEDAREWASARENAAFEGIDDWTLVCRTAEQECPQGAQCTYAAAACQVFSLNARTLSRPHLAGAIRDILIHGPKKTTRVPFLVGPSNSGKSTLVYPFDDLFSPRRVLHKPALGSTFGLRNLVGGSKRFIFWDDFRPVEFAHEKTVPVSLFLSLFVGQHTEIQVSQSFNDGNMDVTWKRGVVFTGKLEGLWEPTKRISHEDVRHMRNRVQEFVFSEVIPEGRLHDVVSCATCMARWIVQGARDLDASRGLRPPLPLPDEPGGPSARRPAGFAELVAATRCSADVEAALLKDLESLGAVGVAELTAADWAATSAWASLRPLERRRAMAHLSLGP